MIPASRPAIPSGTAKPISAPAPSPAAPHRSIVATSVRPAPAGGGRDGSVMLLVLVLHAGCSDRRRNQAAPAWSPRRGGTLSEQRTCTLLGGGCATARGCRAACRGCRASRRWRLRERSRTPRCPEQHRGRGLLAIASRQNSDRVVTARGAAGRAAAGLPSGDR